MDLRSLHHIVGLTAHDRTSKSIFHPIPKMKPPTVSTQFQVCLLYIFNLIIMCHIYICGKGTFNVIVIPHLEIHHLNKGMFTLLTVKQVQCGCSHLYHHSYSSSFSYLSCFLPAFCSLHLLIPQASLRKLMDTIEKAEPFFIFCLRSNAEKVSSSVNI